MGDVRCHRCQSVSGLVLHGDVFVCRDEVFCDLRVAVRRKDDDAWWSAFRQIKKSISYGQDLP